MILAIEELELGPKVIRPNTEEYSLYSMVETVEDIHMYGLMNLKHGVVNTRLTVDELKELVNGLDVSEHLLIPFDRTTQQEYKHDIIEVSELTCHYDIVHTEMISLFIINKSFFKINHSDKTENRISRFIKSILYT